MVTSIIPRTSPDSASFSIDWPPVPVAWKVYTSYSASSASRTAVQQAVVTPNIVMPTPGLSPPASGTDHFAMPATAWAALPITRREMALMPATSATEYIMAMSFGPT